MWNNHRFQTWPGAWPVDKFLIKLNSFLRVRVLSLFTDDGSNDSHDYGAGAYDDDDEGLKL